MQKRLFLGISVPDVIKKRLFRFVEKNYGNLPVSWTSANNYHVTFKFFGFVSEQAIPELCENIRNSCRGNVGFELSFTHLEVGPSEKNPRLLWVSGLSNSPIIALKDNLDVRLGEFAGDSKKFSPHITVGRIRRKRWREEQANTQIRKEFFFNISVDSLDLYESKYEKGKRMYYVMESFPLDTESLKR